MASDATENIQKVLAALKQLADKEGAVPLQRAVNEVSELTGLSEVTVRYHFKALAALKVVEVSEAPEARKVFKTRTRFRQQVRLLKPAAVIVKRGGFYALE